MFYGIFCSFAVVLGWLRVLFSLPSSIFKFRTGWYLVPLTLQKYEKCRLQTLCFRGSLVKLCLGFLDVHNAITPDCVRKLIWNPLLPILLVGNTALVSPKMNKFPWLRDLKKVWFDGNFLNRSGVALISLSTGGQTMSIQRKSIFQNTARLYTCSSWGYGFLFYSMLLYTARASLYSSWKVWYNCIAVIA